ncbi:MAG TPA: hypothetical protein P5230_00270 [Candidatus Magasanikbacteria bacterium]|nr:hypothetical protein [Candidatus Magasanikbacteria bacterium]
MTLNESFKKAEEILGPTKKDIDTAILSLQESATKIWQAVENDQKDKINTRAANALISVFYVMRELGINDPENCLSMRFEEIKNENK